MIYWTSSYSQNATYLNFYNCIFNWTGSYGGTDTTYLLPSTATCYNCLSINKSALFKNVVSGGNNKTAGSTADVFIDGMWLQLTDEAKSKYIGTDGTEIGLRGGLYPWNTTVQYPTVTTFNAESKTSKEGILNIEVGVDE